MHWLHHMTGFQLFVVGSIYSLSFAIKDAKKDKTGGDRFLMVYWSAIGLGFSIYWTVVAAIPAVT